MNMYVKYFWVFSFSLLCSSIVLSVPFNTTYNGSEENNETTTNSIRFNILTANQKVNQNIFKRIKDSLTSTEKNSSLNISECDCGPHSKCAFIMDKKKCFCEKGYKEYKEQCMRSECNCGSNSLFCTLDFYDKKQCYCIDGYSEYYSDIFDDWYCQSCDCGVGASSCKFDLDGVKICDCKQGYARNKKYVFDEKCEKCDCGQHAKSCEFLINQKKCYCQEGYKDFKEKCLRPECDCGPNSLFCTLDTYNETQCSCKDGYSEYYSVFLDHKSCQSCDCGVGASSCKFDLNGTKICDCKQGYARNKEYFFDEKCEKCDCGPHATACEFVMNQKKCKCQEGYAEFKEECLRPELTSVSGWKIATYIILGICGIVLVILITIIRKRNKRTRT